MKKTKEIGYELGNVYWHNLEGFQKLWNKTDTETKDKIVNGIGELAVKLVSEADTKITRLRNLLTPMKNYIAMVNADKRGESISTLLLDRELETINKYSDEIWAIIAEIPNDACDGIEAKNEDTKALRLQIVVFNGACKCEKPDPYKQMPNKCFRCQGKIEISEVEVCACGRNMEKTKPNE